ncbi:MAG: ABC transporter substrate-binding protein [Saprospiraceae bacterium]
MRVKPWIFIGILGFLLLSCKSDKTNLDPQNVLDIRLKNDPERINPLIFPNPMAREVYQYIFLPLADYDPNTLVFTPVMIVEMPEKIRIDTGHYAGHTALNVEILKEAKWDDGSPITGHDYAFTIKAINLPLTNAKNYRQFTHSILDVQVDRSNPKKFTIIVHKDETQFLEVALNVEVYPSGYYDKNSALSTLSFADLEQDDSILKQNDRLIAFAETFNSAIFSRDSISGSGPYKLTSWSANQNITLHKKENFWGSNVNHASVIQGPDILRFHIIPDELLAITQLKAGNIDVINEVSADNFIALKNDSKYADNYSFLTPSLIKQYVINLNNNDVILQDVLVRKAMSHMIDVDNIIEVMERGMGRRSTGYIHPEKETYDKALKPVAFDLDKSSSLLKQAGWTDIDNDGFLDKKIKGKSVRFELEILISGHELGKKIALMLQENAKKVGCKINISEKEFKMIKAENLKTRQYQMVPAVVSQDIIRWDDLSKFYGPNDTPTGVNDISYHNPVVDSILIALESPLQDSQRLQLYKRFQQITYEDVPMIYLYSPVERIIVSKIWDGSATLKRPGYLANTFTLSHLELSKQ